MTTAEPLAPVDLHRPLIHEAGVPAHDPQPLAGARQPPLDALAPAGDDGVLAVHHRGQVHDTRMPSGPAVRATCAARALAIIVLVGVQPVFTQVPPSADRSMTTTFLPWPASFVARGTPPCPVPMTITSVFTRVPFPPAVAWRRTTT
jgi:hypothetical protein